MINSMNISAEEAVIRSHDITVCLERSTVPEFDFLTELGMATRLALHLRGVPAVQYDIVRQVAYYLLDFPATSIKPIIHLLADIEFIKLDTEGNNIKTIIPDIPYYENLFSGLGELTKTRNFSEPELLTLDMMKRLSSSPLLQDQIYQSGADKQLISRVIDIGTQGSFILSKRARGRDILLSPTYFPESPDAYADLVVESGAYRVKKILDLLKQNQGWPMEKLIQDGGIAGVQLDDKDLQVIKLLAGDGFLPPPAIETQHAGINHFLFGPRPGRTRMEPTKRPLYEAAMALVASMRQGQLLPRQYAIRSPIALLSALRDRGFVQDNSEANEQYRKVATLRVARLEPTESGRARLVLIPRPENYEAIDMAISMLSSEEPQVLPSEEIIIAMQQGEKYVESLVGRKRILKDKEITEDPETKAAIDSFLLRGRG